MLQRIGWWVFRVGTEFHRIVAEFEALAANRECCARREPTLLGQRAVNANSGAALQVFHVPPAAIEVKQTVVLGDVRCVQDNVTARLAADNQAWLE